MKKEMLRLLSTAMTKTALSEVLSKKGVTIPLNTLQHYIKDLLQEGKIYMDKSVWPPLYSTKKPVEKQEERPVHTQSGIFPEFIVAVKRKGKEFRHMFKDETELGTFLDGLDVEDEVAIYRKVECKKEVKAVWKLS